MTAGVPKLLLLPCGSRRERLDGRAIEGRQSVNRKETTAATDPAIRKDICQKLEAFLWQERERIYAEIHDYPPPIPACDAQFNYLIEKRAVIGQELGKVHALAGVAQSADQKNRLLREYVATSQILNRTAKEELVGALLGPHHSTTENDR